ncbi:hypothetical protein CAOG_01335 [Capsaspora owczarzaki ATCC 30864]|uniref:SPRY domain-containing protein 7 n=1 Tax=Capsaspora owczarzaki (strain ATCC 30864) TaxID=595528 RepID=A0A0D2U426_CAPO3|nr:hypothetical protein CAOG_01335 [Capsaspora owczarzaki ATCC 30864]KJE89936.1 hypothetical protein CAOG_001335 [Capsaspora owczarzaki ATCC 30864]|eukprot:XP_004349855.1 hypothetical protein CAOG_01335 [Capsaspora owczarzaki ATCC 30864]
MNHLCYQLFSCFGGPPDDRDNIIAATAAANARQSNAAAGASGDGRPEVLLDSRHMAPDCVIVKAGKRLCGSGAVLATAPLAQDKSYFEVKLQAAGRWGVGVASRKEDLAAVPLGNENSWVLRSDSTTWHKQQLGSVDVKFEEGDVLGFSYDHVELNIFHNGKALNCPIIGVRGTVYPAFYVDEGAILDVIFHTFVHTPPTGFTEIMLEKNIL